MTDSDFSTDGSASAIAEENGRVLVVESDPGVRWSLERGLAHSGFDVLVADSPESATSLASETSINAVLFEILPEAGFTFDALSAVIYASNSDAVVCSSIDASPNNIMECLRRGGACFLQRPFSLGEIRSELHQAIASSQTNRQAHSSHTDNESLIIGESEAAQKLRAMVRKVAESKLNCLIRGSSGVGKDVVAREIHRLSSRREKPLVKVNCTALPEPLLESELFGYEKGAFTGADTAKPGRFMLADRGIIFLDEICDMPMSIQAKLLQVTEHKQFMTLGGKEPVNVDVQLISASNAPFEQRIQDREFRSDLFFRINEISITVPTLSERSEDIPILAKHFIQKHRDTRSGKRRELTNQELDRLCAWDWPGNIRELESTIKRWMVLGNLQIGSQSSQNGKPKESTTTSNSKSGEPSMADIIKVLEECQWNRTQAAKTLGINYQTLRRRIAQHNIVQ